VLFSQTCGYPPETVFSRQAVRLGTPRYIAPGCDGPTHCGFFIVPARSKAQTLWDLEGDVFLLNHRHSNSGMNLPRRSLVDIAGGRP
jgi:ABC-type phosphate/phosphonate transport system substrate-binding protein